MTDFILGNSCPLPDRNKPFSNLFSSRNQSADWPIYKVQNAAGHDGGNNEEY